MCIMSSNNEILSVDLYITPVKDNFTGLQTIRNILVAANHARFDKNTVRK